MKEDAPTPKERLEHIIKAIDTIHAFTQGIQEEDFIHKNLQVQSAVLYQFIIIGEAIKNVDRAILEKYDYPWHLVRTFRNFVAHVYHKIKLEKIWNTIQQLDKLKQLIEKIIEKEF